MSEKYERDAAREMKQKEKTERVEKGFKWWGGESKDERRGASPHVPYLTSIGQSL